MTATRSESELVDELVEDLARQADLERGFPPGSSRDRADAESAAWPDPEPLEDPIAAPPASFPTDQMPPVLRDMIRAVAGNKQVPEDLPALLGLAAAAVLAGPRVAISRGNGWVEPLNLYTCVGMESGAGKTPAEKDVTRALHRIQKKLIADHHEKTASEIDQLDLRRAEAGLKAADANRIEDDIKRLETLRDFGYPRLLFGSDTTVEVLSAKMSDNGDHAGIMDAEGEFFSILAGRYSNGTPNIGLVLKAYDGDWYDSNRITRTTKPLHRAILTLGLGAQPTVLAEVAKSRAMVERGLLARFLLAVPESLLGTRKDEGTPYDRGAMMAWDEALQRIGDLEVPPSDTDDFPVLHLSPGARQRHAAFRNWIEPRLAANGGDLSDMPGWAAKHTGRVLRISGLLHLLAGYDPRDPVSDRSMFAAVKVAEWAIPHARIVFGYDGPGSADDSAKRCREVLEWIRSAGDKEFVSRECRRGVRKTWVTAASMLEVLDELIEKGWLRQVERRDKSNRIKAAYVPHPSLLDGAP